MSRKTKSEKQMVPLWDIACTFLQIGAVSFSLAALGEAKNWLVKKKKWFNDEEYLQGVAFSQILPGAPVVSLMTYTGYHLRGFLGAAVAAMAYLLPAVVLILLFTYLYASYHQLPIVANLFKGLGALVVGLVINTVIDLWQSGVNSKQNWILALGGFALIYLLHLSIYQIFIIATGVSVMFMLFTRQWPWWAKEMAGLKDGQWQQAATAQLINWRQYRLTAMAVIILIVVNMVLINTSSTFFDLGTTFMQLGGLVFGSGYAMLPFIQEEAINSYHWVSNSEFTAALALSLVLPGPLTKIATAIGYQAAGLMGALVATLNIYLPTFCIINLTADFYRQAGQVTVIRLVVRGIVAAFIGTLWAVVINLVISNLVDIPTVLLALAIIVGQRFTQINTLKLVLVGAAISVVLFSVL